MTLVFDKASHRYYNDEGELPSVTSILSAEGVLRSYDSGTMFYAQRGTFVHRLCEAIDKNVALATVPPPEDVTLDSVLGFANAYRAYVADFSPSWTHIEEMLAHPIYNYAGTLDRAFPLLDIKTGSPSGNEPLQLAGYYELLRVNNFIGKPEGYFLNLSGDGTYKLVKHDLTKLTSIFYAVKATFDYKRRAR